MIYVSFVHTPFSLYYYFISLLSIVFVQLYNNISTNIDTNKLFRQYLLTMLYLSKVLLFIKSHCIIMLNYTENLDNVVKRVEDRADREEKD